MIPQEVQAVLRTLEQAGHEAYVVGGCVRDMQMGLPPHDWDVTTSALPQETMALFPHFAIPTGLQHGTVTVRTGGVSCEVTTFRTDGDYPDHRHPAAVSFTRSLREDLARRDLTVNAMAMDLRGRICDPFGGQEDLSRRVLRCVGDPLRRLDEDALRIMRALRFAAVLGFAIEPDTSAALHRRAPLLADIAAERILVEMNKLLTGEYMASVLLAYPDVLGVFLPELLPCVGFDQRNVHHCYDVWTHSVYAASAIAPDAVLRWAMLLHDIGKALDHEFEGTHVSLGVEYARKYKEKEEIVHAIQAHHGDVECKTLVACLVQAADAVSAARPGARRENLENYIKRLEKLEEITSDYPGVEKSYAIQAGREVRVMVKPEQVSEDQMVILAHDLARRIESELEYPGQIKVHVLRETKVVEYAK